MAFSDHTPPVDDITAANLARDIGHARWQWVRREALKNPDTGNLAQITQALVEDWNETHPALLALWHRCEAVVEQETDRHERPPLAGVTWCESQGPRYGDDGTYCTLPAGHRRDPERRFGKAGCRYTFGRRIVLDDSAGISACLFAPGSVEPGPAITTVRVLATRTWGDGWKRIDRDLIYRRYWPRGWYMEMRLDDGSIESVHDVGSWEELTETRVLVDHTGQPMPWTAPQEV
jgi:hypothetical protein